MKFVRSFLIPVSFLIAAAVSSPAALAAEEPICFPAEEVYASAAERGLEMRNAGSETGVAGEPVIVLLRTAEGESWSLWRFVEGEGCYIAKGKTWVGFVDGRVEAVK